MIPAFLAPYVMRIAGALIILLSIAGIYQYIKNKGHEQAIVECKANQDAYILKAKNMQANAILENEKIKHDAQKRTQDAIQKYVDHYNKLIADTPDATSLRVRTKESNACSSGVSTSTKDRSKVEEGNGRTGEAELPERNLRLLNAVISKIERLELNCERILNTMP